MSKSERRHRAFALAGLLLAVPAVSAQRESVQTGSAQTVIAGTKLPVATEVPAIITGLRNIGVQERLVLAMDRICRTDITHPDCPHDLKATSLKGRLPSVVWVRANDILKVDKQLGEQHISIFKATYAYVQRPVAVGDSILMLVQLNRPVDGAPRQLLFFDVVLRGDSTHMEVVRSTPRTDRPVK